VKATLGDGPFELGESIAIDGVCLTVNEAVDGGFEADASFETLARTTLGRLPPGATVHIERSLRAGSPMGGHLVSGHVDGVGALVGRRPLGDAIVMAFHFPHELARFVAEKGSVTVDGVSLTVNTVSPGGDRSADTFEVAIVPHTLAKTKLGALSPGDPVNLEVDLVARYVARILSVGA
jgi:riboflavin synthase